MTWLTVTVYLSQRWLHICFVSRGPNPVFRHYLSSYLKQHDGCYVWSGNYLSFRSIPGGIRVAHYLACSVVFCWHIAWPLTFTGAGPGFQVRGAHLKKLRRAEGCANIFGVFRVKNHDFTPTNFIFYFFQF